MGIFSRAVCDVINGAAHKGSPVGTWLAGRGWGNCENRLENGYECAPRELALIPTEPF